MKQRYRKSSSILRTILFPEGVTNYALCDHLELAMRSGGNGIRCFRSEPKDGCYAFGVTDDALNNPIGAVLAFIYPDGRRTFTIGAQMLVAEVEVHGCAWIKNKRPYSFRIPPRQRPAVLEAVGLIVPALADHDQAVILGEARLSR